MCFKGSKIYQLILYFFRVIFLYADIFYDKTCFTCNWVDLNSFKNIMTSGFIEDMKITQEIVQENLKQVVSIPISTPPIYQDLMNLDT